MRLINTLGAFIRDHMSLTWLVPQNIQVLSLCVVVLEASYKATWMHQLVWSIINIDVDYWEWIDLVTAVVVLWLVLLAWVVRLNTRFAGHSAWHCFSGLYWSRSLLKILGVRRWLALPNRLGNLALRSFLLPTCSTRCSFSILILSALHLAA